MSVCLCLAKSWYVGPKPASHLSQSLCGNVFRFHRACLAAQTCGKAFRNRQSCSCPRRSPGSDYEPLSAALMLLMLVCACRLMLLMLVLCC